MNDRVRSRLIERAARRFEHDLRARRQQPSSFPPRVITLSRQLGSGERSIVGVLTERLDWPVWDREILDVMASQSQLRYQARMFEALDEKTQSRIIDMADSILGSVDEHVHLHLLTRAILTIGQQDGIILGRGANLLLPHALKVCIVAPLESRVKRVMQREELSEATARKRVADADRFRESFLQDIARRLGRRRSHADREAEYDLVINTDAFGVDGAASMILQAVEQRFGSDQSRAPGSDAGAPLDRGASTAAPGAVSAPGAAVHIGPTT
jgi:cytidylate kinase